MFLLFWPHLVSCGILAPQPGIKPQTPAVEMQTQPLDHLESLWGNLLIYQVLEDPPTKLNLDPTYF